MSTSTTTTVTGWDVTYCDPCGMRGVIFRQAATAEEAMESVREYFAAENYTAGVTKAEPTVNTADKVTYLVVGPGVWGHGDTLEDAKSNMRRQGGRLTDGYYTVEFPVGITFRGVTGMGGYRWEAIDPAAADVEPVEILVKGKRTR